VVRGFACQYVFFDDAMHIMAFFDQMGLIFDGILWYSFFDNMAIG